MNTFSLVPVLATRRGAVWLIIENIKQWDGRTKPGKADEHHKYDEKIMNDIVKNFMNKK